MNETEFDHFYDFIEETLERIQKICVNHGLDWFLYTTASDLFFFVTDDKYMESDEDEEVSNDASQ